MWNTVKKPAFFIPLIFLLLFIFIHLTLIGQTFWTDSVGNVHSTHDGYGDMPLHLTMITKFAFAPSFDLRQSIFYGTSIHYHFAIELIRGYILRWTGNWPLSIHGPIFLIAALNCIFIFFLYRKFLKKSALAIPALLIFYLGANFGAFVDLIHGIIPRIIVLDTVYPAQSRDFGPVMFVSFVQQQAFFLGTLCFLVVLWLLFRIKERGETKYAIFLGLLIGIMPFIHAHSFIISCLSLGVFGLITLLRREWPTFKRFLTSAVVGAVLALPQIYYILTANSAYAGGNKFSHFRLGWMMEGIGAAKFGGAHTVFSLDYISFLWTSFGLIVPLFILVVALLLYFMKKGRVMEDWIYICALLSAIIFALVMTVKFQPWDFDDNKLLVYFLFYLAPLLIYAVDRLVERRVYKYAVGYILTGTLCLSGFALVYSGLTLDKNTLPIVYDKTALDMADYIRKNIPFEDTILTSTEHKNPAPSLAGKVVVMGYPGWLWSFGNIDYGARESAIKAFYKNPTRDNPLLQEFHVKYILLDRYAMNEYGANKALFDGLWEKIFEIGDYSLYSVNDKSLN